MKSFVLSVLTTIAVSFAVAGPVLAHHSFMAEYDVNKEVTLTGTVTRLEWTNPHARFYMDVKDATGATAAWEFELGSPNTLVRYGWFKDTMKVGDVVTVEGYLAKDGSKMANAKLVKLANGRVFSAGSSATLSSPK